MASRGHLYCMPSLGSEQYARHLAGKPASRSRRLKDAGLPTEVFTCHSIRATVITNLLDQGLALEDVQRLAGHADPRTTRLYDRSQKEVTRNIVERISIAANPDL
jgi:integrase